MLGGVVRCGAVRCCVVRVCRISVLPERKQSISF